MVYRSWNGPQAFIAHNRYFYVVFWGGVLFRNRTWVLLKWKFTQLQRNIEFSCIIITLAWQESIIMIINLFKLKLPYNQLIWMSKFLNEYNSSLSKKQHPNPLHFGFIEFMILSKYVSG